jgi:hypothetical protein
MLSFPSTLRCTKGYRFQAPIYSKIEPELAIGTTYYTRPVARFNRRLILQQHRRVRTEKDDEGRNCGSRQCRARLRARVSWARLRARDRAGRPHAGASGGGSTDIRYGLPLLPRAEITAGDYDSLAGSALVMITAGVNEKTGGATDRNDPQGACGSSIRMPRSIAIY